MTSDKLIKCAEHGDRVGTFVCQHLAQGRGVGFHYGYGDDEPDAMFPDAWCDACEAMLDEEGGWNEHTEGAAGIQLLCAGCYMNQRQLNWPESTFSKQAALIQESVAYLRERQETLVREFSLDDHQRYDWDQGTGLLVFSNGGVETVRADFEFVGSISTRSNTWLWSWANQSDEENLSEGMRVVRARGEEQRLLKLACACWPAEEADGWDMAAVAARLREAQGVYRSPHDTLRSFLLLTNLRWVQ